MSGARAGVTKVQRRSLEFKRTAVRLSRQPGIAVQAVAAEDGATHPGHEVVPMHPISGDQPAGSFPLRDSGWSEALQRLDISWTTLHTHSTNPSALCVESDQPIDRFTSNPYDLVIDGDTTGQRRTAPAA